MYTCMCLHTRKLMHTCTYIQVCSCVYLNTQYIHTNMFSYTIYMYTSILVYTHMHAYLATHIHMYLHVGHKQTSVDCCSCTYMHTSSKGHVHTWYVYTGMLDHIHAPWHAPMHTHTQQDTHICLWSPRHVCVQVHIHARGLHQKNIFVLVLEITAYVFQYGGHMVMRESP